VPETAMHKNGFRFLAEHKIRFAWQVPRVQTVPVAHRVDEPPHLQFGLCPFASDGAHVGTAPARGYPIHQITKSNGKSEM